MSIPSCKLIHYDYFKIIFTMLVRTMSMALGLAYCVSEALAASGRSFTGWDW